MIGQALSLILKLLLSGKVDHRTWLVLGVLQHLFRKWNQKRSIQSNQSFRALDQQYNENERHSKSMISVLNPLNVLHSIQQRRIRRQQRQPHSSEMLDSHLPHQRNASRNRMYHDEDSDRDSDDEDEWNDNQAAATGAYAYDTDVMAVIQYKNDPSVKKYLEQEQKPLYGHRAPLPTLIDANATRKITGSLTNTVANAVVAFDRLKRFITADDIYTIRNASQEQPYQHSTDIEGDVLFEEAEPPRAPRQPQPQQRLPKKSTRKGEIVELNC